MKKIRLTNKGRFLIFVIAMIMAFTTGFTIWKITGLPNLATTYSEAGSGCKVDKCTGHAYPPSTCTDDPTKTGSRLKCPDGTWVCTTSANCDNHQGSNDDPEPMEGACATDGSNRCSNADPKCGTFCVNTKWGTCNQAMIKKGCTIPGGTTLPIVSGLHCSGCTGKETVGCGTGYNGTIDTNIGNSYYNSTKHSINCNGYCGSIQCDGKDANGNDSYTDTVCSCDNNSETPTPPSCDSFSLSTTPADVDATSSGNTLLSVNDTVNVGATAKDPDGNPQKIYLCTAINKRGADFYSNDANWKCYERSAQKTINVSKPFDTYATEYVAAVPSVTKAEVEENGLKFITKILDNSDANIVCQPDPTKVSADNFNPIYTSGGTGSCGTVACGGIVTLGTPEPYCGDGILQDNESCDYNDPTNSGSCSSSVCNTDCTCPPTEPYCGDGILQDNESCDYNDPTNSGSCSSSVCNTDCTCPPPGLNIKKVGSKVCIEGKETYADVTYKITVANSGDVSGHISQIVDDLDSKVQDGWVVPTSVTPSAGSTINGNTITWDLETASQEFSPGEEMVFSYVVRVPDTSFGSYTNVATAIVTDEGEENVSATATIAVDCTKLPDNGLFDSTIGKITLAAILLISGAYYSQSENIDNLLFNTFTKTGRVEKNRRKFEKK